MQEKIMSNRMKGIIVIEGKAMANMVFSKS